MWQLAQGREAMVRKVRLLRDGLPSLFIYIFYHFLTMPSFINNMSNMFDVKNGGDMPLTLICLTRWKHER